MSSFLLDRRQRLAVVARSGSETGDLNCTEQEPASDLDTFGPYLFDILQQESRHSQERRDILITPVGALGPGGSIGGMGGLGGAKVPRTPPLGGVAQTEPSAPPPEPDPPETERANFDAENHPLAGVPNVEARHDRGWLVQVVSLN